MNNPFVMVIFGATGDLAQKKLVPSVFSLFKQNKLPDNFQIVGFSRRDLTDESFRSHFTDLINQKEYASFAKHLSYQKGNFDTKDGYENLLILLKKIDKNIRIPYERLLYLATPPSHYETILGFLDKARLSKDSKIQTKIIVEKPFGKDLETAVKLDKKLSYLFEENQIFRVDHYLGKETVQNMVAFRFANGVFEPVWNRNYIDHIQITFAEDKGVGNRGNFFDGVGMLRDVAQNHLMQLIAAVAMEQPRSFTREDLRNERAKVIKAIRPIDEKDVPKFVIRGQYSDYKKEKNVLLSSNTETFVAAKFFIDTPRLEDVPFYVRAGKKMPKNVVEISIVFIQQCHILFKEYGCPEIGNVLTIRIQPDEGISLRVISKSPGAKLALETVDMKFTYQEQFKTAGIEAYDRILLDIFAGDQMLFNRSDELASSWKFITKILNGWEKEKTPPLVYESGTWGPKQAEELIKRDGRKWL